MDEYQISITSLIVSTIIWISQIIFSIWWSKSILRLNKQVFNLPTKVSGSSSSNNTKDINKQEWINMSTWAKLYQFYLWNETDMNTIKDIINSSEEQEHKQRMEERKLHMSTK